MRNPQLKKNDAVEIVKNDESLLQKIVNLFSKSRINYQTENKMLQCVFIANQRISMTVAHKYIDETTKAQRQLKQYLSLGRNHRVLLDSFWIMQTRGDKDIILGDEHQVDSLAFAMFKSTDIHADAVRKILSDGVKSNIFKRVKHSSDKRRSAYEINATDDLTDAYIHWGNTHLGITGSLNTHVLQSKWDDKTQEALYRQSGWWGTDETSLSIEQKNRITNHYAEGSVIRVKDNKIQLKK
jgi:hypothetical protein